MPALNLTHWNVQYSAQQYSLQNRARDLKMIREDTYLSLYLKSKHRHDIYHVFLVVLFTNLHIVESCSRLYRDTGYSICFQVRNNGRTSPVFFTHRNTVPRFQTLLKYLEMHGMPLFSGVQLLYDMHIRRDGSITAVGGQRGEGRGRGAYSAIDLWFCCCWILLRARGSGDSAKAGHSPDSCVFLSSQGPKTK